MRKSDGLWELPPKDVTPEDERELPPDDVRIRLARLVFFPPPETLDLVAEAFGEDSRIYANLNFLFCSAEYSDVGEMFDFMADITARSTHLFEDLEQLGDLNVPPE